jgi:hypothetical protein
LNDESKADNAVPVGPAPTINTSVVFSPFASVAVENDLLPIVPRSFPCRQGLVTLPRLGVSRGRAKHAQTAATDAADRACFKALFRGKLGMLFRNNRGHVRVFSYVAQAFRFVKRGKKKKKKKREFFRVVFRV